MYGKRICICCKKRVATIEDDDSRRAYPSYEVCRKCYDASEKSGLVKSEFYNYARAQGFIRI